MKSVFHYLAITKFTQISLFRHVHRMENARESRTSPLRCRPRRQAKASPKMTCKMFLSSSCLLQSLTESVLPLLYLLCFAKLLFTPSLGKYLVCHARRLARANQSQRDSNSFFFCCVIRSSEMLHGPSFFVCKSLCQVASKLITPSAHVSAFSQAPNTFPDKCLRNISSVAVSSNRGRPNFEQHFKGRFKRDSIPCGC